MKKLCNWLLFGLSTIDIYGPVYNMDLYADCVFVISKDSFQAYLTSGAFKEFTKLSILLSNCNIYTLTKTDEANNEKQEVIKIGKFFEMVHDKKSVGVPVRKVSTTKDVQYHESELIELWPMIQAYGLDMVGNGFFTMKHNFVNIRDDMTAIYKEYDAFSKYRLVNEEIDRIHSHFFDNFFNLNRDTISKR